MGIKARISVLTLGVSNLEKSISFYRDGLGLPTEGIIGQEFKHGTVAFFDLGGGLKLALSDVAHDTGLLLQPPSSTSFTIGHNVSTMEEVEEVMAAAERAGAEIVKRPVPTFYGGYAGYFRDPRRTFVGCGLESSSAPPSILSFLNGAPTPEGGRVTCFGLSASGQRLPN